MGVSLSHRLSDNTQYWQAWFSFVFLFLCFVLFFNSECNFFKSYLVFSNRLCPAWVFHFYYFLALSFCSHQLASANAQLHSISLCLIASHLFCQFCLWLLWFPSIPFQQLLSACSIYFIKLRILFTSTEGVFMAQGQKRTVHWPFAHGVACAWSPGLPSHLTGRTSHKLL